MLVNYYWCILGSKCKKQKPYLHMGLCNRYIFGMVLSNGKSVSLVVAISVANKSFGCVMGPKQKGNQNM